MYRPWFKRLVVLHIATLIIAIGLTAAIAEEWGVDRPGGDYRSFDLSSDTPSTCEQACQNDPECRAWTFVRPGVQGPAARCWLKDDVPPPRKDSCCVSGVRPAQYQGSVEPGVDRPGSDYRNFSLAAANPQICRQRCLAEPQCRAWTYVEPGVQGPSARCWLKNAVPIARSDDCCVSGVK